MTYPPAHPGPPQGQSGPSSPSYAPQAAYGRPPVSAPQGGTTYGQAPTPAGYGAYVLPEQGAIPTQSVPHSPGASALPGQPHPSASAHVFAPQYQPHQQQYQQYQQGSGAGSAYLSGAVTAPGYPLPAYPAPDGVSRLSGPRLGRTSSQSTGAPHHVPWRGEKAAALVMMIVACALEFVIYMTFLLNLVHGPIWVGVLVATFIFVVATPMIWWHYSGLRHLYRNQPVTEMLGLALWFGYGVLTMPINGPNKDPYAGLLDTIAVLLFVVTAVGAVLTVRLNQRLRTPQSWGTTLAVGACQFVLINGAAHLSYFCISLYARASTGRSVSQYTTSAWFIWSESGGAGLPMVPGLLVFATITSLAAIGVFLGVRRPSGKSFRIVSTSTVSLLTLYNIVVILVYGVPTIGEYAFRPSSTGIVLAIIIGHGGLLIASTLAAGSRHSAVPPAGHSQYRQYRPSADPYGMQSRFSRYHQPQSPWGGGY